MVERIVLTGDIVTLHPLSLDHVDALVAAANEDRATYRYTPVPDDAVSMRRFIAGVLDDEGAGWALPFATTLTNNGRVVGTTRFLDLDDWSRDLGSAPSGAAGTPRAAEIGGTWLAPSAQRTAVNTEAKLLMLRQAFDTWEALRITLKSDARNTRSRTAIERLGSHFEGIRRAHAPAADGTVRDTAYYSIVRDEWPTVEANLVARLSG